VAKSQLRLVAWIIITIAWSATVVAAEKDRFVTGIEAIPYEALKYVLFIVAISGSAATLTKLTKENAPIIKNLPLELLKDGVTSFAAGVFAFFVTSWQSDFIPFWLQAVIIFMAGYGGSRFLEAVYADGFTSVVKNFINRMLGKQAEPPVVPPAKEETPQ
jgi:hypothetical protein